MFHRPLDVADKRLTIGKLGADRSAKQSEIYVLPDVECVIDAADAGEPDAVENEVPVLPMNGREVVALEGFDRLLIHIISAAYRLQHGDCLSIRSFPIHKLQWSCLHLLVKHFRSMN